MAALLAAAAVLLGAPLIDRVLAGRPRLAAAVDGILGLLIGVAVFGAVLPFAANVIGWKEAVLVLTVGAVVGVIAHRFPVLGDAVSAFAFAGLALHALVDGVALAGSSAPLRYAVVAHNVPVGMALWRAISPGSPRVARLALLLSAFITLAGWLLAAHVAAASTAAPMAVLQVMAAGMLLHSAWHLLGPARQRFLPRATP